jgi:hypothetical protein
VRSRKSTALWRRRTRLRTRARAAPHAAHLRRSGLCEPCVGDEERDQHTSRRTQATRLHCHRTDQLAQQGRRKEGPYAAEGAGSVRLVRGGARPASRTPVIPRRLFSRRHLRLGAQLRFPAVKKKRTIFFNTRSLRHVARHCDGTDTRCPQRHGGRATVEIVRSKPLFTQHLTRHRDAGQNRRTAAADGDVRLLREDD